MSRYTVVRSNRLNSFGDFICDDVKVIDMFEMTSVFKKIAVELCLKIHIKIPKWLFNKNLVGIDSDSIIVFDGHARPEFLTWLAVNNPRKRMIFWCWNTVKEIEKNLRLQSIPHVYEIWSYSERDCIKYSLMHNTTFYWSKFSKMPEVEKEIDLYFVGKDKGRYKKIKEIEEQLSSSGIKCFFQIIPTHILKTKKELCRRIPYEQVLKNISKAKGILDIEVTSTAGPSLRSIEAAFFNKKLVTDNKEVKNMKFYDPRNIFIMGGVMIH